MLSSFERLCFIFVMLFGSFGAYGIESSQVKSNKKAVLESKKDSSISIEKVAEERISNLGNRAFEIINTPQITQEQVIAEFEKLLKEYFAVDKIATSIAGKYNKEFVENNLRPIFGRCIMNMLVKTYSSQFSEYKKAKLSISSSQTMGKLIKVSSLISIPGKESINIIWDLKNINGKLVITDVKIQNIGLIHTQNSDICGRIKQIGVKKFVAELQEKYDK